MRLDDTLAHVLLMSAPELALLLQGMDESHPLHKHAMKRMGQVGFDVDRINVDRLQTETLAARARNQLRMISKKQLARVRAGTRSK